MDPSVLCGRCSAGVTDPIWFCWVCWAPLCGTCGAELGHCGRHPEANENTEAPAASGYDGRRRLADALRGLHDNAERARRVLEMLKRKKPPD
jgi:hypothetical protein